MPDMKRERKRMRGAGTAISIVSLLGAAAGWVVYDLKKPNSIVRGLIEIGRAKLEGNGLDRDKQIEAAADVQEDVMDINENGEQVPPPEQMPS